MAYLYIKRFTLSWNVVYKKECSEEKILYFDYRDRKVYTKCIEKIFVTEKNDKEMELKDYILKEGKSMDSIFKEAQYEKSYQDGGSFVYYYNDFAIVSCAKLGTSNDIVIMNKDVDVSKVCS